MQELSEALEKKSKKEEIEQYKLFGVNVNVASSEKKFVNDLFNSLNSIPTGQNALKDMAEHGTNFYLESALGSAGGYFDPENNVIVMAKSLGMDFMEFALVHEARHLIQNVSGRNSAEANNLDYASRLMINRATEADAQTQAIKACKEWEAQGHTAPLERFNKHYPPIVDAYNKNNSLSDAFKGWYDDERICASYERGYDIENCLSMLFDDSDVRPLKHLEPKDIRHFSGADRVEGFDEFLATDHARKIHVATQTAMIVYDMANVAKGADHDETIATSPIRETFKTGGAAHARSNSKKMMDFAKTIKHSQTKEGDILIGTSFMKVANYVAKIEDSKASGKKHARAEALLKSEMQYLKAAFDIRFGGKMPKTSALSPEIAARIQKDAENLAKNPNHEKPAKETEKPIQTALLVSQKANGR